MGGGGNQKWTGNYEPVIIADPIPKNIGGGTNKGYDIEGIPGLPSPKAGRRSRKPKTIRSRKKTKKTPIEKQLDRLFGREKTKRTKSSSKTLTKYEKWKKDQKNHPQNITKREAEKARRQTWKSLSFSEKELKLSQAKFLNKKSSTYFKKTGKPPTSSEYKKWNSDFKKHQKQQQSKTRTDTERLFGKMTDKQWKEHQQKRAKFRENEAQRRKRGY